MDIIKFVVKGQHLHLKTDLKRWKVTSDTLNYFKCHFEFSSEWAGYDVRIYFKNASFNITKVVVPDSSGYCFIPWEVLAHTGAILCTVTGIKYEEGESLRLTTQPVNMFVHNSNEGSIGASDYVNPTPTEYEQFINQVGQHALDAISAKTAAIEAQIAAELAEYKVEHMTVSAVDLAEGSSATVTKTDYDDHFNLEFGIPSAEDGFSPSASVSKVGDTATITITDKDGTTTAEVYDGSGTFVAEYGVTTYDELHDAFFDGKAIILLWQSAGYDRYFPVSAIYTGSSFKLTFLMGKSIAYDVVVSPFTPPFDWSYSSRNLQDTLVSGTNIKTVNNTSLLGSGNIDTKDVFIAVYGESSFAEIENAIGSKQIYLSKTAAGYSNYYPVSVVQSGGAQLDMFYISRTGFVPASTSVLYHASITSSDVWSFEEYPLQPKLVSGTNIKTINSQPILGSGNIDTKSDWDETDSTSDAYILNKPTIPNVFTSTLEPTSADGEDGDVWFIYYPLFTVDDGTDTYDYQFELGSSWATFVSSSFNNNKFSVDTETDEVLWVTTGTRIYTDTTTPVYILKTDLIETGETYYVEAVPISEPEEPESGE